MSNHNFLITPELIPSERLSSEAVRRGVGGAALMRDFVVVREYPDATVVAVGDMANNLVGQTEHTMPEVAEQIGFADAEEPLNGGLIGSYQLKKELERPEFDDSGRALIARANGALEQTYEQLKMPRLFEGRYVDPATLFTGYLTHARIGEKMTTITSVGDVYAWVNGQLVAGAEKTVDTRKEALVQKLTDMIAGAEVEVDIASVQKTVREFAAEAKMAGNVSDHLFSVLVTQIGIDAGTGNLGRQTAYRPVDDIVTPWQIRELQNYPESAERPWAYGAIDGRMTPARYITVHELPTADIDTLVIATDGSTPGREDGEVHGLEDLAPVNPEYSERGMLAVRRRS